MSLRRRRPKALYEVLGEDEFLASERPDQWPDSDPSATARVGPRGRGVSTPAGATSRLALAALGVASLLVLAVVIVSGRRGGPQAGRVAPRTAPAVLGSPPATAGASAHSSPQPRADRVTRTSPRRRGAAVRSRRPRAHRPPRGSRGPRARRSPRRPTDRVVVGSPAQAEFGFER